MLLSEEVVSMWHIYEEFKGTGNMEIHLDRKLSEKRIFPAIDLARSGTRREEMLLSEQELLGIFAVRKMLSVGDVQESTEKLISMMMGTDTNKEFIQTLTLQMKELQKKGQPTDDLVNGIANATDYTYTIEIQPDVTEQVDGFIGQMSATIELNGEVVDRNVAWSGNEHVDIDASGNYTLSGGVGDIAIITATLSGNSDVIATCNVEIVESIEDNYEIVIDPSFDEVRQKQPMTFTAYLYQNGVRQDSEITCEYSGLTTDYFALSQDGHTFILSVLKLTNDPLTLTFLSGVTTKTIIVALKPLF